MIIRVPQRQKYTVIDNQAIEDPALSWRALGMLAYLLSRPDNWEANYRHLGTVRTDGQTTARACLRELEEAGYIQRHRERGEHGRFQWVQVVLENPQVRPCGGLPGMVPPGMVPPGEVDGSGIKTESTKTEETSTEEQTAQPEPLAPLLGFDEFWQAYPRRNGKREGKRKAQDQWRKLDLPTRRLAWRGAVHYAAACEQHLTIAADAFRWLRDRRWEDWQDPAARDRPLSNAEGREVGWQLLVDSIREDMTNGSR